jgi:zinc transporter 7
MIAIIASLVATFVVSIIPIGILTLLPNFLSNPNSRRRTLTEASLVSNAKLNVLLCFAAGSLVADAFLHLLPQSMFGEYPSLENARHQACAAVGGICIFLVMDILTRVASRQEPTVTEEEHEQMQLPADQKSVLLAPITSQESVGGRPRQRRMPSPNLGMLRTGQPIKRNDHCHPNGTSGVLSLMADALHNFTDGLALAASFSRDIRLGLTTTAAILFHEVPHELGDYAILAKSGYNHQEIIKLQVMTAGAAFLGTFAGIVLHMGWLPFLKFINEDTLLPFAAGGFLYVALCSILPEVLNDLKNSRKSSTLFIQILSFGAGIALMALIE